MFFPFALLLAKGEWKKYVGRGRGLWKCMASVLGRLELQDATCFGAPAMQLKTLFNRLHPVKGFV